MIGVNLRGRMGNQLFQFAFAYATAKKLKTSFFINESAKHFRPRSYFELGGYNNFYNDVKRKWFNLLNYKQKNIIIYDNSKLPSENLLLMKNNAIYSGFFQSEEYFKDSEEDIRRLFKIKDKYINSFNQKFKSIFSANKILAIHLRRTDYLSQGDDKVGGKDVSLPILYYKKCMERIKSIDEYLVIFVSDSIDYARESFGVKHNYRFEFNSEIIDFQVLLNADILIISNSTFAWWAAYLNNKNNKVVFAPKYWLGFKVKEESPAGIMLPEWNWSEVS